MGGPVKTLVCPALASHKLKTFFFWGLEKPDSRVCFPCGSQPTRPSHSNGQGIAERGTAAYAEDEACELNTCGSVCSQVWAPGCKAEEGEELGWNSPWWAS